MFIVQVTETDSLPKKICRFCIEEVERCYRFHKTVVEAEKQLLAFGRQISLLASDIKVAESERNPETFLPCDTPRDSTTYNNIEASLETASDVEMINREFPITITKRAQTADTITVKNEVLLSTLRPCSVLLSRIEVYSKNNSHPESERNSSSDSKLWNPDPTTEASDLPTTTGLEAIRKSTCDSAGTSANHSGSIADGGDISTLRAVKKVDHVRIKMNR